MSYTMMAMQMAAEATSTHTQPLEMKRRHPARRYSRAMLASCTNRMTAKARANSSDGGKRPLFTFTELNSTLEWMVPCNDNAAVREPPHTTPTVQSRRQQSAPGS